MRIKTTREKRIFYFKTALRWTLYYVIILMSFVIMTTGSWKKPVLLVPVALCIAINNDIMASAYTGAFCGFLIDIACGRLIGYNAVILTIFSAAMTLIFELYLRRKFINYIVLTAIMTFLQCFLDFQFFYKLWDYENVNNIFRNVTLKVWIYTMISSVILYVIFRIINNLLMPKEHLTIEEVIRNN
ncbi:MAG: rod shape-determining protein MreD [Ruminococcus sp.]|nr:rod shape-determining protein MreD [Ruminococcus sp.]